MQSYGVFLDLKLTPMDGFGLVAGLCSRAPRSTPVDELFVIYFEHENRPTSLIPTSR